MARKKSDTVAMQVRMKESLRAQIEAAAKENDVSMNAETVSRLADTFALDEETGRLNQTVVDMFGGLENVELAMRLLNVLQYHDYLAPNWRDDEIGTKMVAETMSRFVERLGYFRDEPLKMKPSGNLLAGDMPPEMVGNQMARWASAMADVEPDFFDYAAKRLAEGGWLPGVGGKKKAPSADDEESGD